MTPGLWKMIGNGVIETLQMTVISTILAYVIGLPLGILLIVTSKRHILQNRVINLVLGTVMNIFRSIPFLILLVVLIPFTRFVTGSSIAQRQLSYRLRLAPFQSLPVWWNPR